ncbi:MAG: DEAD/DEAH box helicase [Pseudomonadota bacterium]
MPDEYESQFSTQRAEKPKFLTQTRFDELNLPPEVLAGLRDSGLTYCTPIQAHVLPVSLTGRDVAGQAQTGTGKTAVFLATIFTKILALPKRKNKLPLALIVAPTRELAIQIYEDAKFFCNHTGLSIAQVIGGIDYQKQAETLRQGADIIICTPGRIIDYLKQGIFKTNGIKIVVIDEADRLFDLGFTKDMRYILRNLPHYEKRQSMLFSATLSYRVMELTYDYMNLPEFISVTPEEVTVEGIEQSLFHVGKKEKLPLLLGLLKREELNQVLIFVNTKAGVEWLTRKLKGNGWPAEGITGDLPQRKRLSLMKRYKDGNIKILVATDVASRGIHVEDISHVINYDLPQDVDNYLHRIGRTARAGKTGRALTLVCEDYVFRLKPLEEMLGYNIPVVWPEDEWFIKDKSRPFSMEEGKRRKSPTHKQNRGRDREKKRPVPRKTHKKTEPSFKPKSMSGLPPVPKSAADSKSPTAQNELRKERKRPYRKKPPTQTSGGSKSSNSQD